MTDLISRRTKYGEEWCVPFNFRSLNFWKKSSFSTVQILVWKVSETTTSRHIKIQHGHCLLGLLSVCVALTHFHKLYCPTSISEHGTMGFVYAKYSIMLYQFVLLTRASLVS